jgi:lipoprotein-releasing system permease protein
MVRRPQAGRSVIRVRLPYESYLALRYLRFHRGRTFLSIITLISVAGVSVGTAALVIALALMTGFQQDIRRRIESGSAHLTVLKAHEPTFEGAEGLAARVRAVPGVKEAGPVLLTHAMLVNEEAASPAYVELEGIDPARHGRVIAEGPDDPLKVLSAPLPGGRDGIVLGEELGSRLGVRKGDRVRLLVPKVSLTPFTPIPRSRVLEVLGTFHSEAFPLSAERAYVSLETARRLLDAPAAASWVEVRLGDDRLIQRVKKDLSGTLGSGYLVVDLLDLEQNRDLLKALNTEKFILFLAIALIVVVASLNIVSTLILMVADKVKEIGTLTAMGARPFGIALVFVLQGLVIGVVGTSLGLAAGSAASWWLDRFRVIKLNPEVYYITHVPFTLRPIDAVFVAALTLGVSLLATIYPAFRAATLDPVEAIRHE